MPDRWLNAGAPDSGRAAPLISSHRGAVSLAPENTLWAYRYALAYEVALIEVDVRQTADNRFVAFHDSDLASKSNGEGRLEDLTFDQARALNVADYAPWRGSVYDPAQMASLEEVLELARAVGHGIEFDMKFMLDSQPQADLAGFAAIVNQYPDVLKRSIINLPPVAAQLARALILEGRFIYNLLASEPATLMYPLTQEASVFGSSLAKFTPEHVAAIHDGCALVMPHSYDAGREQEGQQILLARAMGADGVQTNQPSLARALLVGPVATALVAGSKDNAVCLVNAGNGLGLPQKSLRISRSGSELAMVNTELAGCADLPLPLAQVTVSFSGDGSAAAAQKLAVADTTPNAFGFTSISGVGQSVTVSSNVVTISGIDAPSSISIAGGPDSQYRINGGGWTSASGSITNGQTVQVRHTSANAPGATVESVLNIGGVEGKFRSTTAGTAGNDTDPAPFSFGTKVGQQSSTVVESDAITLTDYDAPAPVTAGSGTEYSLGCAGNNWTNAPGTLNVGQSICVRHTTASGSNALRKTSLKVGTVVGYFTTRTAP